LDIKDKVAVITGGARGLGKQFANDLAKKGGKVVICDVNYEELNSVKAEFEQQNFTVDIFDIDVTNEESVVKFYESVAEKYNGIDISVNNAGITKDHLLVKKKEGIIEKFPFEDWQKVVDVNLSGVFLCAREAAYQMVKYGKNGVIVSMSSISRHGNLGQTNYTATKAGVSAMTVTWAKELSRYGIRVVAIAPGYIETEMTEVIPDNVKDKITGMIPLKRFGKKEEISKTLQFIIENDYITGRTIEVDGGLRI
jgi:3-oxoacyl-[acyl-carrier protein] reductase